MAEARTVFSDASPLIALAGAGAFDLLRDLFGTVTVTSAVRREVLAGRGRPGDRELRDAIKAGWIDLVRDPRPDSTLEDLGDGEATTLAAAAVKLMPGASRSTGAALPDACFELDFTRPGRLVWREVAPDQLGRTAVQGAVGGWLSDIVGDVIHFFKHTVDEVKTITVSIVDGVATLFINGISYALNTGIRMAAGKYICQLDSDDEYAPETLEKMVGHFESHPKCGLAISYYELMEEDGSKVEGVAPVTHSGYTRNQILRRDGAGALRVFPKVVLEEMGYYDEANFGNFGEDYDMVLKVGEKYDVDRVHAVLYRYRRHPDNTDVTRDPMMKVQNKNNARLNALRRRTAINKKLGKA